MIEKDKMNILLLGGTGAMGVHLIQLYKGTKHKITVTSRSTKKSYENIHFIQGNALDDNFLKKILNEKWDAIVDFMVYSTKKFGSRVDLLLASCQHYIYLSSARVFADSEKPITENSLRLLNTIQEKKYLNSDEYALKKARQEDVLKNTGKSNWTIIRPYITYSEKRLQLGVMEKEDWLYRALKGRTIVFNYEMAKKLTTLTYGQDVAKTMIHIIGENKSFGHAYNITQRHPLLWGEILNIYLKELENYLGKPPKLLLVDLKIYLSAHPSIFQVKYDRLYSRVFSTEKIDKLQNKDVFVNTIEGITGCLHTFLDSQEFKSINWKNEALKDKLTKEFTSLSEIKGIKHKLKYIVYRYTPVQLTKLY